MYVNIIIFALYIDSCKPQRSGVLIHSVTLSNLQIIKVLKKKHKSAKSKQTIHPFRCLIKYSINEYAVYE